MENQPVLSIRNLTKHLGGKLILRNISLDVPSGEVFGFLGPNGSGKTTTIKLMLGLLNLEEGSISICGHDIVDEFEEAMSCIGGIIENPEMYRYMTGRQNLEFYRDMYEGIPDSRIDEVIGIVGLEDRINDKIAKYSLGMRQRLGVAQALLAHPKLLVLDEPTNGLDPAGIHELRDILIRLTREEGCSVFVSSHMLAELDQMCDRVCVIDRGEVIAVKSMNEMHDKYGDGRVMLRFKVPDVDAAANVFRSLGYAANAEGNYFRVLTDEKAVPALIRSVSGKCDVYEVATERRSLEDAYLAMTGEAVKGETRKVGGFADDEKKEDPRDPDPESASALSVRASEEDAL